MVGAPLSDVQMTNVCSAIPSSRSWSSITPIDQSSSSIASPQGPFLLLPLNAGLENGGESHGAPGLRPEYHEHYYGAFLLDPDGNNVEAVCHHPEE